jgi:hypothetical protein
MFSILASYTGHAGCWKVGEFSGVSAKAGDAYAISKDGMSGQSFMVQISGSSTAVIPNDLSCKEVSSSSVVCIHSEPNRSVVETWSVDAIKKIAFYTKVTSGYAIFDGPNLFVGKIIGECS